MLYGGLARIQPTIVLSHCWGSNRQKTQNPDFAHPHRLFQFDLVFLDHGIGEQLFAHRLELGFGLFGIAAILAIIKLALAA